MLLFIYCKTKVHHLFIYTIFCHVRAILWIKCWWVCIKYTETFCNAKPELCSAKYISAFEVLQDVKIIKFFVDYQP